MARCQGRARRGDAVICFSGAGAGSVLAEYSSGTDVGGRAAPLDAETRPGCPRKMETRLRTSLPLLLPLLLLGATPAAEFRPPADPGPGSAWSEDVSWESASHTRMEVGGVQIRDKDEREGSAYRAIVRVLSQVDGKADRFRVTFSEASASKGDEREDLGLAGAEVESSGLGDDQEFERVGGGRIPRRARSFLAEHFSEAEPEPTGEEAPDPLDMLLPDGPLSPGDTWSLDLDEVEQWAGPEQFKLDRGRSRARAELLEIVQEPGGPVGRFSFDVVLVPSRIKDVEFSLASMAVRGTAEVPTSGTPERLSFDVTFDIRLVGRVKMGGLKADVDLSSTSHGTVRRDPVEGRGR